MNDSDTYYEISCDEDDMIFITEDDALYYTATLYGECESSTLTKIDGTVTITFVNVTGEVGLCLEA